MNKPDKKSIDRKMNKALEINKILEEKVGHKSDCSTVFYKESGGERGSTECDCRVSFVTDSILFLITAREDRLIEKLESKRLKEKYPDTKEGYQMKHEQKVFNWGIDKAIQLIRGGR